ncbi:MAG: peptide-methionine (S)-S-oxide reductase MsrA [Holophagaceae bacterium]
MNLNSLPLHAIYHEPLRLEWPDHQVLLLGMGCFWGAERLFWRHPLVKSTSVGYAGGTLESPTYQQVCTGETGHAEVVQVVFDQSEASLKEMMRLFWENHDPTQHNRQGPDIGSQYRSVVFTTTPQQMKCVEASRAVAQVALARKGLGDPTTEILPFVNYFLAENYHQQYLQKNPQGYCSLKGTGIQCVMG